MQIGSAIGAMSVSPTQKSGSNMPPAVTGTVNTSPNQGLIRELSESFDPKDMSYNESLAVANTLIKAGEADLSSAFLPPPLMKVNQDGTMTDMTGTAEGNQVMNNKFNMFESLTTRIEFNKSMNMPTQLLEETYAFLEKVQVARDTPRISEYT
jgi:hypothetical protein